MITPKNQEILDNIQEFINWINKGNDNTNVEAIPLEPIDEPENASFYVDVKKICNKNASTSELFSEAMSIMLKYDVEFFKVHTMRTNFDASTISIRYKVPAPATFLNWNKSDILK